MEKFGPQAYFVNAPSIYIQEDEKNDEDAEIEVVSDAGGPLDDDDVDNVESQFNMNQDKDEPGKLKKLRFVLSYSANFAYHRHDPRVKPPGSGYHWTLTKVYLEY